MQCFNETKIVDFHQYTYMVKSKYTFKWTLEDVNKYGNTEMDSEKFYPDSREAWWVTFSMGSKTITLYLKRNGSRFGSVKCECKVKVTDSNNKIWLDEFKLLEYGDCNNSFGNDGIFSGLDSLTEEMMKTEKDTMIISLFLIIHKKVSVSIVNPLSQQILGPSVKKTLTDDLIKLFENQTNTDVILKVSDENIGAHKSILSARSPVFEKMFQQVMSETQTSVIDIQDITYFALKELIAFIYGKYRLDYDFQMCIDAYYAADKYQVVKFKDICRALLTSNSTVDNAGQILRLANIHNDAQLKTNIMKFIRAHWRYCIETDWWEEMMRERSPYVKELEHFLVESV